MVVLSNKSAHADQALVFTDHKNYLSQSIATPEEGLYFLQKHFPVCGDISSRNHRKHITILKKNLNTLNDSLSQPVPLEYVNSLLRIFEAFQYLKRTLLVFSNTLKLFSTVSSLLWISESDRILFLLSVNFQKIVF